MHNIIRFDCVTSFALACAVWTREGIAFTARQTEEGYVVTITGH